MIAQISCRNWNHGRANVPVRFCSMCGEVVNKNIPVKKCSVEAHARRRRNYNKYCVDCSEQLIREKGDRRSS